MTVQCEGESCALGQKRMGSNPGFVPYYLWDCGQVTQCSKLQFLYLQNGDSNSPTTMFITLEEFGPFQLNLRGCQIQADSFVKGGTGKRREHFPPASPPPGMTDTTAQ